MKEIKELSEVLHLKDLALTVDEFNLIFTMVVHNQKDITADRLFRCDEEIYNDIFHTRETKKLILDKRSVDLMTYLIKNGMKIKFLDGEESLTVIKSVSPPIYDRHFSKSADAK